MKLAILGADADVVDVAQVVAKQRRHTVSWLCETDGKWQNDWSAKLWSIAPDSQRLDQWESLLDSRLADGVFVATSDADDERRAEQLRRLVQAGVPILVSHPVVASMLVYYELEMLRSDLATPHLRVGLDQPELPVRGVIVPVLALRRHPAIAEFAALAHGADHSPIGDVEQLVCERHLVTRDRQSVTAQFARDADLMRAICGEFSRLGAMGQADDPKAFASLSVQLATTTGISARWSIGSAGGEAVDRLVLHGVRGRATLSMPAAPAEWTLVVGDSGGERTLTFPSWSAAAAALDDFEAAIAGRPINPTWLDATKTVEIAETAQRSLKKGRMLDLYREEFNEEGTFKGTMASAGCGLLIVTLVSLVCTLLLLRFDISIAQYWPYLLLAMLAAFLAMQMLVLVLPRRDHQGVTSNAEADKLNQV